MTTYALTLWQPWASLVVLGLKPYEFRGRSLPVHVKGRRVVMHAAQRVPKARELLDILQRLYNGHTDGMHRARAIDFLEQAWRDPSVMPLSAGVGSAVLAGSTPCDQLFPDDPAADPERWGWHVERPREWSAARRLAGAQGFWHWPRVLEGHE